MSVYNRGKEEKRCIADNPTNTRNKTAQHSGGKNLLAGIDRDTLLTAAVMLLMIKNGGDKKLILALGYIIVGGSFGK